MYKLFICLRYLRSRVIAYFAVLGVALCVAMVLIVISVMNGFLDKIEGAAKGLFGDIVIESTTLSGFGYYDEFTEELKNSVPEVEAASPFIFTYGLLRIPGTDHNQDVQIAGIRLPGRAYVSDFEKGLFVQKDSPNPTFDPAIQTVLDKLHQETEKTREILRRECPPSLEGKLPADKQFVCDRLWTAIGFQRQASLRLTGAQEHQEKLSNLENEIDKLRSIGDESEQLDELLEQLITLEQEINFMGPANRMVLGRGIRVLTFRTDQGETVRIITPGQKVELVMIPLGRKIIGSAGVEPASSVFSVIDDCRTDVHSIDSKIVYIPFETLQRLNNMEAEYSVDDPPEIVRPARCTQIHVKISEPFASDELQLRKLARKIQTLWSDFESRYPDAATTEVSVQTWRQRQREVIGPIEKQRDLTVIMFGIISIVSVVLIFVIFYMIVVQKTKDIGILKAVGASSGGVAAIFLTYGAAIGLIGSIIGVVGGYYFVRYINPIQDWLADAFGWRVWSKEVFLFEKIPNEVDPTTAIAIVIGAILAGLLGAIIPAIRAARMQPVEALRYE